MKSTRILPWEIIGLQFSRTARRSIPASDRQFSFPEKLREREHRLVLKISERFILEPDRPDHIDEALPLAVPEFVGMFIVPTHRRLNGIAEFDKRDLQGN
jgi:hypothetical protein